MSGDSSSEDGSARGLVEKRGSASSFNISTVLAAVALLIAALSVLQVASLKKHVSMAAADSNQLTKRVGALEAHDSTRAGADSYFLRYTIDQEIGGWAPVVDLHSADVQDAGRDFLVSNLSVAAEAGGARISGVLVNESAVNHEMARFTFSTRGINREFTVRRLPAGGSSSFSVDVPGLPADSTLYGSIHYVSSTVSYRSP